MCLCCQAGFHEECEAPVDMGLLLGVQTYTCCCTDELVSSVRGPLKEDDELADVESTGRKRAAVAYPIQDGQVCEWAKLRYAGGGVTPIIGCNGNPATDRHHGPDKSTLNNGPGNVHRICATCHNRWHSENDHHYGDRPPNGRPFIPLQGICKEHDATTEASIKEIFDNEVGWNLRRKREREAGTTIETNTSDEASDTGTADTSESREAS